jgi:hypothetical protein
MAGAGGKSVGRVSIRVLPDTTKFRNDLQRALTGIEKMMSATIKVDANTDPFERSLKRLQDHWNGQNVTLNADADTGLATARLAALTRPRQVAITPKIPTAALAKVGTALAALSGARLGGDFLKGIGERLGNLDKALPKIVALATSIASLAALALSAGGGLATLAASLSSILAVSALAPALIGGAGVSLAVLMVALSQAGDRLGDVVDQWKQLGAVIGDNFWGVALTPLRELSSSILPAVREGVAGTASALGQWTASLAAGFQAALGGGVLEQLFARLNESIGIAAGGTGAFASALVGLGVVGSDYLPRLAQWIADLTTRFDEFIARTAADGSLRGWIDGGIVAAQQLGSVLFSLGSIVASVADAAQAAGGGGLGTLATLLSSLAATIASSGAQEALTTLFSGAAEGASGLATALGPITSMFGELAPVLADIMSGAGAGLGSLLSQMAEALAQPEFQTGLTAFFDGILTGIEAIGPAMPELAAALGSLGVFAGALAAEAGPLLADLLTILAPLFTDILTAVEPLLPVLSAGLRDAIEELAPVLVPIVQDLLPVLIDLFIAAVPVVVAIARAISELQPILDFLLDVVEFGVGLWTTFLKVLGDPTAFSDLRGFIESIGGPFGDFLAMVADAGAKFGDWVRDLVDGFVGMVQDGVRNVKSFINDVIGIVNGGIDGINGALSGLSAVGLDVSIPNIPELALGATINPTEGGTLVRVAEKGRAESVVDTGLLNRQLALSNARMAAQQQAPSAGDRPVYMQDGTLFAVIRELANGQAELIVNAALEQQAQGSQRRKW